MGVRQLQSFIQKKVPGGTFPVDIRNEVRKYYSTITTPNPPAPVIVVDLIGFVYPFCRLDGAGVLCGGRFNEIYRCMNQLFGELASLGVQLEFFHDGPMRSVPPEAWFRRKEQLYRDLLKLFDAVDKGAEVSSMMRHTRLPFLYDSTLKRAAMNHGRLHWATTKECDQELAAYANKCQALAILSDDTDFLVYEGSWRLWCPTSLNFDKLTTVEYDRVKLTTFLELRPSQMPLLATLAGNDVVNNEALKNFHRHLGKWQDKIPNVAKFIRQQENESVDVILARVLGFCFNKSLLMGHFQESLELYQVNDDVLNEPQINDPIEAALLSRHIPLFYQIWHSKKVECKPGVTDMRQKELGEQVPQLKLSLILRMGGIILHQRQTEGDSAECNVNVMIKLRHDTAHGQHSYRVEFPTHIKPPSIEELLSNDPVTCSELQDTKLQLFCWIASDSIDHHHLEVIPKSLQITVLTLYSLLEKRALRLFEADLILQIAHDVTFAKYDPQTVAYPQKLDSRPFRVAFVFQAIYGLLANAFNLVGLSDAFDEDPPFDGVLFHEIRNYYSSSKMPNPAPPVIVVDLMCLVNSFCHTDSAGAAGAICGGRFTEVFRCVTDFFGELNSVGAVLEFFIDGAMRSVDPDHWCHGKDAEYHKIIKLFDAVDQGEELSTMVSFERLPCLYFFTLKRAAMKHGNFHWAGEKEGDQETVAFANKSNALAILSNHTDLLIYEGSWRLWWTKNLDIKNLTTIEYDREALMDCLKLQRSQMPLLATLAGNSIVDPESLVTFQKKLGRMSEKMSNVANFIRAHQKESEDTIFTRVLPFCSDRPEMMARFKKSLNLYQVKNLPFAPFESNLDQDSRNASLYYQMWHSKNIKSNSGVTDLRQHELGEDMPQVKIYLMRRMGGIVLYHRQTENKIHIMIKLRHSTPHTLYHFGVERPTHIEPPPLEELLSNDPITCTELRPFKMQLLCWIVSDNDSLDYRRLEAIPQPLQTTVLTLYCLVDRQMIRQFEADLLLQIAHDVAFSTYDPQTVGYPQKLASRPFRLAFVFQQVYYIVGQAFKLFGLSAVNDEDPPFDGVLFHNWYDDWSRQHPPMVSIRNEWRLYDSIAAGRQDEVGVRIWSF